MKEDRRKVHPSSFVLHPFASPRYGYRPADRSAPPAVSIITPYYNTGPLFIDTIRSVLRQSLQQWEWIIVNDGSIDLAALQTLLPLRSADERIRVIDTANGGPGAARNAGVAASRAPLLFFLDSDNLLAPTTLETLAWTLYAHPQSSFAGGWTVAFGHENILWPRGFDTRYAFPFENMASSQSMVRREAFDTVGGFDEARREGLEDFEFWMRAAASGLWGHDVREYLIWSRRKPPEAYTSYRWAFQDGPRAEEALQRELRARYPHLYRNGVPFVQVADDSTHTVTVPTALPFANHLERPDEQQRMLLLLPSTPDEKVDRLVQRLVADLTAGGDRVTVCLLQKSDNRYLNGLQTSTEDVFTLPTFLPLGDYPRFLHYLIESRQITTVLIANSPLGYQFWPYLRSRCPSVACINYVDENRVEVLSGDVSERLQALFGTAVTQTATPTPLPSCEAATVATVRALRQYQIDMRRQAPLSIRLLTLVNQSVWWQKPCRVLGLRSVVARLDRKMYVARRTVMRRLRTLKR